MHVADCKSVQGLQGRRMGYARGGANMFLVELDMMVDMGEGCKGVPLPFGKFVLI